MDRLVATVRIADREVGPGHPCFVIAEAGVNHNGDVAMAIRMIDTACRAGADAVKFQTFISEEVVTLAAPKAEYQMRTTDKAESQLEMVKKLELPPEAFRLLRDYCRRTGIIFLSTPFDLSSADLLEELEVPAFKVASGEITNLPFLEHIGRKRKPVILSTGMSTLDEVATALRTLRQAGTEHVAVLQCVSSYPASAAEINLRAMSTMTEHFLVPVGFSDHTTGIEVALAAVSLGACIVEKHFTLDRNLSGPDHRASLEPDELLAMVVGIRKVEASLGDGIKRPSATEQNTAAVARRSLVAASDLTAGTTLTVESIAIKRPGTGLAPSMREQLVGRRLRRDVSAGTLFSLEMLR
jgi:N,N'-diacetyllegionaminate synthase